MRIRLLASLLALTLAAPLHGQGLPPLGAADALGQDLFLRSGSTGLVLVVVRNKEIAVKGFGETGPGSGAAPGPDSLLRLCSLTKIFATDLLVKLIQQPGAQPAVKLVIRLDTPLQLLAPHGLAVPMRDDGRPITLGDLATHTAGLPREIGPAPRGSAHFTYPGPEARWRWLPSQHLRTTPGTAALYSNIGFDLLGDALEQSTQTPYAQLLAAHTTNPLGMAETTFTPTDAQCARLLGGAHPEGSCTPTTNSAGSSGLYSTGTDMARFLEYLLGTGGPEIPAQNPAAQAVYLLPANLVSVQGLDHAGDPTGIGLGWIHTPGSNGADIVEKTGGGAGFLTYIAMLPAQHLAIFVAATDGSVETHINLFRNANNVLLTLAGLPTLYIAPPRPPEPATHLAKKAKRRH